MSRLVRPTRKSTSAGCSLVVIEHSTSPHAGSSRDGTSPSRGNRPPTLAPAPIIPLRSPCFWSAATWPWPGCPSPLWTSAELAPPIVSCAETNVDSLSSDANCCGLSA